MERRNSVFTVVYTSRCTSCGRTSYFSILLIFQLILSIICSENVYLTTAGLIFKISFNTETRVQPLLWIKVVGHTEFDKSLVLRQVFDSHT